jgi:small subunit ribosomal protein S16
LSVIIRLRRGGKSHQPMYRFVATDSRMPRDGRFLEVLGWYRPLERPAKLKIDVERTIEWLKKGAIPSDTVSTLYKQVGMAEIWQKHQKGEDISSLAVRDSITEKQHKVKSKARARMVEKEKATEAPAA